MFEYFLTFLPKQALICVKIKFEANKLPLLSLKLPAWRPGRYQLQNFAKNIRNFSAFDSSENKLSYYKSDRNTWCVQNPQTAKQVTVCYEYLATELNAGSSYINEGLIYFNPINFTMYLDEALDQSFGVNVHCENIENQIASGLKFTKTISGFYANPDSMRQWFDSPIMISKRLLHLQFKSKKIPFHFWISGRLDFDEKKFIKELKKIADAQIDLFGVFPEKDYHFMLIVPQDAYYHGVEHANSTMLVLGNRHLLSQSYYYDLLGLASHELFHAWNIAKIRPKELLPYDYSKESYFNTCFVAEGFTTYYGDKIMHAAGVISTKMYFFELETILRRHFENADTASQSLLESSVDLWVDGYERAIPHKRVSVYDKGAIAAFILDSIIKKNTNNEKTLDDVMRKLWKEFGSMSMGYTYADIVTICEDVAGCSLKFFFEKVIASSESIWDITQNALSGENKKMKKNTDGIVVLKNLRNQES